VHRSLDCLRKFCRRNGIEKVLLVTTFWDSVPHDTAVEREKQLIESERFFGSWSQNGCKVIRLDYSVTYSAFRVLDELVKIAPIHEKGGPGSRSQRPAEGAKVGTQERRANGGVKMQGRNSEIRAKGQKPTCEENPGPQIDRETVRTKFEDYRRQWAQALEDRRRRHAQEFKQKADEYAEILGRLRRQEEEYRQEAERLAAERNAKAEKRNKELERCKRRLYRTHRCISRNFSRDYPCDRCSLPIRRYSHYYRKSML
jgi:hypothetical protein